MSRRPNVYGLDIETDTTVNGLDSEVAPVVTVALSLRRLRRGLQRRRGRRSSRGSTGGWPSSPPGVLATWNGAAFDLPFLADRAALLDLPIGLRLRHDPDIRMHHQPLPGHPGAYRARWYRHGHIDAYRLYRGDVGPALRVSCSLKSIARLVGLAPLQVDRKHIHDLSREVLHAYAASDARLARVLTERRWGTAARFVDRVSGSDRVDLASWSHDACGRRTPSRLSLSQGAHRVCASERVRDLPPARAGAGSPHEGIRHGDPDGTQAVTPSAPPVGACTRSDADQPRSMSTRRHSTNTCRRSPD